MTLLAALLLVAGTSAATGTVLVLPPEGRAENAWVGEAVADLLPRDLAFLGVPAVDRADRIEAHEALALPVARLTRATSIRIAEALGASRVVLGGHDLQGSTLTLSLRMLDLEHGTLSAPLRASGPVERLTELVGSLAWDIALAGPARAKRTLEELRAQAVAVPFEALRAYAEALAAADTASRVRLLRRALGFAPGFDEARLALGRLQLDTRESAGAHETLARVAPVSALARSARFLRGVALLDLGRYREAAGLYASLAAGDPSAASLNNHALALLRLGSRDGVRASDVLKKAVELAPDLSDLRFNLGWSLLVEGDGPAAAFWLRGVARQQPSDSHVRLLLVWALRAAGRSEEAEEEWRGLTAVSPSLASLAAPDLARRFERPLRSEHPLVLDEDGRSDAELAAVHVARAGRLQEAGDAGGALRELNQAAYLDPYSGRVHLLLARVYILRGDEEKALGELRVSLWCREDTAVRLELAQLLKKMGRPDEASAEARRVLEAEPGSAAARSLLEGR